MRIVKLSNLSEKERKKVLEEQEERYQQNQQERQRIQKQANDDFVNAFGNGDTNPSHTTTYKEILNSMQNKQQTRDFKKANRLTLWDQIKDMAGNLGRTIDNTKNGMINGIMGSGQTIIRDASDTENFAFNTSKNITNKIFSVFGDKNKVSNMFVDVAQLQQNKRNQERKEDIRSLQNIKEKNNEKIQNNLLQARQTGDVVGSKLTELAPSIGQQIPGMALNTLNPVASFAYFKTSSEANYYDDAKERGMTEEQSKVYSKLMSYVEAGTEQLSVGNIQKGGQTVKAIAQGTKGVGIKTGLKAGINVFKETAKEETANTLKSALKSYGIGIAEEAFQEAITEPIQEFTAMKVAGKDKADWNNMWQRMLQSGFNGALSSAIIAGANMGVSSCQGIVTKIENGQEISNQEYNKAVKDASKKVDIEKLATDGIKSEVNKFKNEIQQNQNTDNQVINQEQKTSQNGFSQEEILRQEAKNKLESLKQNYDENSYNQMQQFIETAPSEKALNQVINDLNKEAETKQVAPLKQKQEVQLPMKQKPQNKSFEDVAFEAMSSYESNEVESPLKNRDMDSIGKQTKVNAYQYDNPQVKPYFQEMAQQMGEDLAYIASPENRSTKKGGGTKLSTSTKAMDILHNEQGYSYNQIAQGLQNIIDDKGSENNAISKKIELVIDEQLRNGYNNAFGKYVEPNQDYINTIQENKAVQLPTKQEKPNIINKKVNEYIDSVKDNFKSDINIKTQSINEGDVAPLDYNKAGQSVLAKKAQNLVDRLKTRVFKNNNEDIHVSNGDIRKSISETLKNQEQNKYKKENVAVFSQLDKVIENAKLLDVADEHKGRDYYSDYKYYVSNVYFDGNPFVVEFDTRMQDSGNGTMERHFRLERVYPLNNNEVVSNTVPKVNSDNTFLNETTSINNSISQNEQNVKSDNTNINNMQNNQENMQQFSMSEQQKQNNFEYKESKNSKVDTFRKDASKYWDNSEKTNKLVNTIEKVINDKGYNIRLDDTLGDNVNGRIVTNNQTGEIEITLNPNSSRTGEFILGHELTHAIQTQEMIDLVNDRMTKDGDLRNAVEDLKKLYNTDEINAEVLADISGQLFGNQEFINNLSVEKPSVFKRIYDKIISLANKITGNSSEALFIKDLKSKWEKAYRENTNAINEAQYSKTSDLEVKQQQNKIIQENNPLDKTLGEHTWINSADDIKTYQEAIDDFGGIDNITPDFTAEDVRKALDTGKITIYSSYPIEQGTFVTPSKMEAQSYAGRSQVYSKEVNLSDVAWIDEVQGQYAKVEPRNNNVTTDNQGNELNPNMQKWAKDSKARVDSDGNISENGNLATVYHTTTDKVAQFNEFNPVGTPYYRFGDQVVNYYTDSKDMSGSYSNNRYKTADTKKLNNINEANDYLKGLNDSRWNDNKYYIENKGNSYYLKENSLIGQEALDFLNGLSSNEIKQLRDNIFVNEEFKNTPYGKAFSWNEFDKGLQEKYHDLTNKYLGSDNLIDIQKRMIEYLENPESYNKDKDSYINKYDNEEQLLRNLKQDIQKKDWTNNSNIQYEGYVNITNPYIIDAEGKNWDSVVSKLNKEIEKNISEIKSDTKKVTDLINLQLESEKKYNQYNQNNLHEEYLLQARLVKDLERGLPLDVRNDIEDTYLFGFNFDDYATKTTKNKVEGKNLVKDLLTKYAEEHDANDIREFNTKIEKYGNLTLNEFLKQAHEAYNTDMKYGKEDAYFKSEVEKILNRDITKAFNDDFITGEQLYKLAKEGFSKNAVLDILGEKQTTNDIVKQVIEMNKNGANYDGVIMKNVLDYGGNSQTREPANLYVTFASNQFKAKDNLNPTSDADIRYSKQNQSWQDYLEKNYKSEGTTTDLRDIRLPMKEKQEVKLPMKQENAQQTQEQNNNTKGENINWNEIERPEENRKFRKHYKSIIESDNTTAEAKSIAKDLMGTDTYVPETNKGQLAQADQRIMTSSPEVELQSLLSRSMNGEKISSVDIAVGERLIQYFSKTGSKQQLQEAIQATAMAGTSAGQTVQALSMLNHQTPQGQATWIQRSVDKMNKELAKKKGGTITTDADGNLQVINKQGKDITNKVDLFNLTPEMIDKIMNSENQEQMYKNIDEVYEELGQQVPLGTLEKIDSWRYFSMLANARTHIRNMVGNLAMGKTQRLKDKLAGGIEDIVSKFNPKMERTKTLAFADKKTKDFAKQDFKNMEVQSRLELNENKYNPQSRLQNARRTFKSNSMENTLGRLFNLNDKLLSAEDGIGLKAGYQKALADYITANKIDVDNITDAQLNKARNYAVQQAKEATFHQANAIASAVAQFENKNLATKLFTGAVLPFKKTPMNVAKAGMEYSPLQIAKSATVDLVNLRKGNISVNQYIDNLSKGMTGTGIALVGYALANAGILKASGGDDKDKEKYEEEQGKQSYSIQIAGKTYSLDWLTPTGIPLFIGAETYKLFNQEETEKSTEKKSEEDRLNQAIKGASNLLNAGATAINPMSEMSMISGLTSALSSYNTSDNLGSLGNIMTNAGKSYVNQFFPTLMGQVAKTGDEYERTTKSTATGTIGKAVDQTINQIKNKIPGLRQTLPIKTDIWGKELKQEVNLPLRAVNNFINPATVKNVSTDKVDMELNKLYEENHSSSLLPDILTKTVQLNKQTYRLSNKEYAEFTKNYGQTSHKLIENFIKTSDYNKLTQEQKETAISNIYSYAKEQNKMDYAKKVNETVKPSTLYTTMKEIEKNGGKQSEYLSYLAKTKGMSKESEKNKVLADSNYSNRTKEIIYTNGTGKDDNLYNNLLSKSNINMTEYLDYKDKVSNKVFSADKDKNGKTVTGSAKAKVINYLNNNITGVGNRLLIAGKSYALQNSERQKLAQYINSIVNTREERIEIYKQLDKNFYVRNGKVYMRVSK